MHPEFEKIFLVHVVLEGFYLRRESIFEHVLLEISLLVHEQSIYLSTFYLRPFLLVHDQRIYLRSFTCA